MIDASRRTARKTMCYRYAVAVSRAVLLILALLQAAGIVDLVRRETCAAECERDGCDCLPGDDASQCPCHCPSAPTLTGPAVAVLTVPAARHARDVSFARAVQEPSSPDPREILHVPRRRAV